MTTEQKLETAAIEKYIEVNGKFNEKTFPFTVHNPEIDFCVSRDIAEKGAWEPDLSKLMVEYLRPNGILVDIGANIGWHSKVAQVEGFDIIAFEPSNQNFEALSKNCTKDGSTLYNLGLGDVPCAVYLDRDETNLGNTWVSDHGKESTEIVRLDDLIDEETARRVNVVKIDVQGYETRVIKGGQRFFDNLQPGTLIIIEVSPKRPDFDMKVLAKLIATTSSSYASTYWKPHKMSINDAFRVCMNPSLAGFSPDQVPYPGLEFDMILVK